MMKDKVFVNSRGGTDIEPSKLKGEIELRDVRFHYPTKPDVWVCDGVSLTIEKNSVVAFVGPSGCGKSSVISLIERFYDPISG
jgi:ABC-type multidrug transport system fused ATPase/permease subunit